MSGDRIVSDLSPRPAFFGRSREISRLQSALDGASSSQGELVLLVGDAGIGKTRTAERVAALATASTGDIAFVDKADGEVQSNASCLIVPFAFSLDAARPAIRTADPKLAFARVARVASRQFGDPDLLMDDQLWRFSGSGSRRDSPS